jgi:hypothetical protein
LSFSPLLPIELLSLYAEKTYAEFCSHLIDSLPLLPNMLIIMVDIQHDSSILARTNYKFDYLLAEDIEECTIWPPLYHTRSPEARATRIFKYRSYRETKLLRSVSHVF